MSLDDDVRHLMNVPLFANVEPKRLKLLAYTSERVSFPAGAVVFGQGEAGDAAYVILAGEAAVVVDTDTGPITVARLGKNAFVGEIAILTDVPRTAGVTAASDLLTLRITKERFLQFMEEFPSMAVEITKGLARRLDATTAELIEARARLRAAGLEEGAGKGDEDKGDEA